MGNRAEANGADRLCIGGALASNVHGRGLKLKPFDSDVESFRLVDAMGQVKTCSRAENPKLFSLAAGGYGLFGVVYSVKLRLTPRRKLERKVEVIDRDELAAAFEKRIEAGYLYGDFQFSIDPAGEDFMKRGVFACYRPADDRPIAPERQLSDSDWIGLLELTHTNPAEAFQRYAAYYLSTDGQVYWSDTQQLGFYPDDYHKALDAKLGTPTSTEIIGELYVPRPQIGPFLQEMGDALRAQSVRVIYGTVRLIEKDDDSFLPWAKERYACVVVNLHTTHTPEGIERSAAAFRRLIDLASKRGGASFSRTTGSRRRRRLRPAIHASPSFWPRRRRWILKRAFRATGGGTTESCSHEAMEQPEDRRRLVAIPRRIPVTSCRRADPGRRPSSVSDPSEHFGERRQDAQSRAVMT